MKKGRFYKFLFGPLRSHRNPKKPYRPTDPYYFPPNQEILAG